MTPCHRYQTGIVDLEVMAIIGVYPEERKQQRLLLIDLELTFTKTVGLDCLQDTLDYDDLVTVCKKAALTEPKLLETLAERILEELFSKSALLYGKVTIKKPGAIKSAKYPYVIVERGS